MSLGDFFRRRLLECGFGQDELANRAGVNRNTVYRALNGSPGKLENIVAMLNALGIQPGSEAFLQAIVLWLEEKSGIRFSSEGLLEAQRLRQSRYASQVQCALNDLVQAVEENQPDAALLELLTRCIRDPRLQEVLRATDRYVASQTSNPLRVAEDPKRQ
jgi:transcriptional regulator with XRE-family HTH domain